MPMGGAALIGQSQPLLVIGEPIKHANLTICRFRHPAEIVHAFIRWTTAGKTGRSDHGNRSVQQSTAQPGRGSVAQTTKCGDRYPCATPGSDHQIPMPRDGELSNP